MPWWQKTGKLVRLLGHSCYWRALAMGVAAGVEHEAVLRNLSCNTVVDVGANRGQFALVAHRCFPAAHIVCFEPLSGPAQKLRQVFAGTSAVVIHQFAIGANAGAALVHVARHDDSSSLLPITSLQTDIFPGTEECRTEPAKIQRLDAVLETADIEPPALLKVDVQGYEMQVLQGCGDLLDRFTYLYVEASFVPLYGGQALAEEVISFLRSRRFRLQGISNVSVDAAGRSVQADFLFANANHS